MSESLNLIGRLEAERCPVCCVNRPTMTTMAHFETKGTGGNRFWRVYACARCGGSVLAASDTGDGGIVKEMYPQRKLVDVSVPARPRSFLSQAIDSLHAPSGAVMLAASSIDAMLKEKGYKEGSLNARIDAAAKDHLITQEMAAWAHEIRLDANDQRHADENAVMPSQVDADRCIEFAQQLAQFLYVLPARVQRGRKAVGPQSPNP